MSEAARAWLAQRSDGMPPSLAAAIHAALVAVPARAPLVSALCDAALAALDTALRAGDDRDAALHLLTADALLTSACEAAVENPRDAAMVAERFGPERLATLFATHVSTART